MTVISSFGVFDHLQIPFIRLAQLLLNLLFITGDSISTNFFHTDLLKIIRIMISINLLKRLPASMFKIAVFCILHFYDTSCLIFRNRQQKICITAPLMASMGGWARIVLNYTLIGISLTAALKNYALMGEDFWEEWMQTSG